MIDVELVIPPGVSLVDISGRIEACCAAEGLQLARKSGLAKYPGCTHWHYQRAGQRGTLEITFWPQAGRIWFPTRVGRTAPWVTAVIAHLGPAITEAMSDER